MAIPDDPRASSEDPPVRCPRGDTVSGAYTEEMRQRTLKRIAEKRALEDTDALFKQYVQTVAGILRRTAIRRCGGKPPANDQNGPISSGQ